MEFTNQEVMFLTSVSRGRKPLGVKIDMPLMKERKKYVEQTIESLIKKGILDDKKKLTREGADILYFWEQYRNSEKHICLNDTFAAVLPNGKLIVVIQRENGYNLKIIVPEIVMLELLKESTYLCLGETKKLRGKWEYLDVKVWKEKIKEMEGCIYLKEYNHGKMISESIFCWLDEQGFLLNLVRKKVRSLSSGVMRRQIYTILGGIGNGGK